MDPRSLRIGFAGTPAFAAEHLARLLDQGFRPVAVYTQPDRPAGRGKKLRPSAVKSLALEHQLAIYQPADFSSPETLQELAALNLDVLIVVAYGLILPESVLQVPHHGCINVHASLLPRWRGAAPIERAILAGDSETGVSIMQMDKGLDTGPVIMQLSTPIELGDNAAKLASRLVALGVKGLVNAMQDIADNCLQSTAQDASQATYAEKLDKNEALINWKQDAESIQHKVNAFFPRSPAYSFLDGERIRITASVPVKLPGAGRYSPGEIIQADKNGILVACQQGALSVSALQIPGKAVMDVAAVLNGYKDRFQAGNVFMDQADVS